MTKVSRYNEDPMLRVTHEPYTVLVIGRSSRDLEHVRHELMYTLTKYHLEDSWIYFKFITKSMIPQSIVGTRPLGCIIDDVRTLDPDQEMKVLERMSATTGDNCSIPIYLEGVW